MSDRVTVERKEFESFLTQRLIDRSQELMNTVDKLEKENKQLRDELESLRMRLRALESGMADVGQSDDALKKARNSIARLIEETDKRISR